MYLYIYFLFLQNKMKVHHFRWNYASFFFIFLHNDIKTRPNYNICFNFIILLVLSEFCWKIEIPIAQ